MAKPGMVLGAQRGNMDSSGAGLPAAPAACKPRTTHTWLLLTAGRIELDDFEDPSNPTIPWFYDL